VRVTAGDRTWSQQLIAGDGFQASNERQLIFGLGDQQSVDQVTVVWPSGEKQEFRDLPSDRQYVLVEGCKQAFRARQP
jgi:hypothetical protein